VAKHFNASIGYVNVEMPWAEWVCCLYKSRQLDEYDRFYQYSLAGGDSKKWTWQYRRDGELPISGQADIAGSIMTQWRAAQLQSGGKFGELKGNLEQAADMGLVRRVEQLPDGRIIDESGAVMDMPPGHFFVPKRVSD